MERIDVVVTPERRMIPRDLGRGGARHGEAGRQAGRGHVRLYAPDRDGNGWYLGEDTKEYENGKVASTKGSWEAGVNGALLGDLVVTKEWTPLERGTVEESPTPRASASCWRPRSPAPKAACN